MFSAAIALPREWAQVTDRAPAPGSLETIAAAAIEGDRDAFERLARALMPAAHALALAITTDPADADDAAQAALISLWRKLPQCRDLGRIEGWFLQIVRRAAYDQLRARRRRPTVPIDHTHPATPAWPDGLANDLLAAIARLDPIQREVLVLFDLRGMRHRAIAGLLGISELMARQHLSAARRRVRGWLEETAR